MTPDEELIIEIKKLNQKLSFLESPLRNAWYNFISGTFRSLGNLFGTVVVAALIVYLFSQFRLGQLITQWFQGMIESTVNQILPQITPSSPFGI